MDNCVESINCKIINNIITGHIEKENKTFLKGSIDWRQRMSKLMSFHKVIVEGRKDLVLKRSERLSKRE